MTVNNVMHMNVGKGETSYANNSGYQKSVMSKSFPFLDEILMDMFREHINIPKCFKMADLGCASGPNTFLAMSHIMDKIEDVCKQNNINDLPEFEVFLNDLPGNDFNNLFNLLPNYENGNKKENCSICGLPGSFYGKLLPRKSTHFAYSSYSTQWLSQIPEGLENKNKENIYMALTSPPEVYEAYAKQYKRDFFTFLSSRAEEIISGGCMVLTLLSRSVEDPSTKDDLETFNLFSETILDMVAEGLVDLEALYSFNLPMYAPCIQEVEAAIEREGSFHLDKMHSFHVRWDAVEHTDADHKSLSNLDKHRSGKFVANCFRAFMEPMLVLHFGSSIIDDLFRKFAKKVTEHLSTEKPAHYFNTVISLSRK